jgi:hypothetical protein
MIAGRLVMIQQGGLIPQFAISPTEVIAPASGDNSTVQVTANCPDASWNVTGAPDWLHFSPASGSGSQTIGYAVDPNPSTSSRSATATIAGRSFSVTQAGRSQPGVLFVNCAYAGPDPNGSLQQPYRTVTAAYQAALNGDTLRLFACNYCETLTLSKPLRLEATNGIVTIGCQ